MTSSLVAGRRDEKTKSHEEHPGLPKFARAFAGVEEEQERPQCGLFPTTGPLDRFLILTRPSQACSGVRRGNGPLDRFLARLTPAGTR